MAEPKTPNSHPRVLMVEGADDEAFFKKIVEQLSLKDEIQVRLLNGKDNLGSHLRTVIETHQGDLEGVGIVLDADDAPSKTFRRIKQILQDFQLPVPSRPLEVATGTTSKGPIGVVVMLMPDGKSTGMLEDVCWQAFEDDAVRRCADTYLDCVQADAPLLSRNIPKAKMRAWLACKEDADRHDVKLWLGTAINEEWWPWDNEAFAGVKDFVRLVAGLS